MPTPCGVARQNHGARQQRRAAAQELQQCRHVKNHVRRVGILHRFAVQDRPQTQRIGIRNFVRRHQRRAERRKRVKGFPPATIARRRA